MVKENFEVRKELIEVNDNDVNSKLKERITADELQPITDNKQDKFCDEIELIRNTKE